ncbi:MAG: tRNA preQ1(34) S-adenosylmethionine ribosyltransferase-isomerase QueA [Patescibacteria group bacterium]|nr:tRNA preQ1(34) S-adenosylmethionine ribosyltransferase-isomerase QueA [Patescibacteria group bacterium]
MFVSDFDYDLPQELIAKEPLIPRDTSRLMIVDRNSDQILHKKFSDLPEILPKNCVLVFNDSKVLKAKLKGNIAEILLTKEIEKNTWECLGKPGKKLKIGTKIKFGPDLEGKVMEINEDGSRIIKFTEDLEEKLEEIGQTPLPPYLKGSKAKDEQYQTIYAREKGSVAAPTAGLHFTEDIFQKLSEKGIKTAFVTLHVGRGTFEPVKSDQIEDHTMHSEWFTISPETAAMLNEAKKQGKKIVSVGTTTTRVLESCTTNGMIKPQSAETDIFIYPGYKWQFIDHLLTNFHLPKSTLLMLISALAGKELIDRAYKEAIEEKYRFFSFGDSMLII